MTLLNEKDVENKWRQDLHTLFPNATITSPYNTDGILELGSLKVLLEFKYDLLLTTKDNRSVTLIQAVSYLKRMEQKGDKLPHIVLVADKNEAFVLHVNSLHKYLSYDVDWKVSPSEAHKHPAYLAMRMAMNNDADLDVFVFNILDNKYLDNVKNAIQDLDKNVVRKVRVTPNNIENVYRYFSTDVVSKLSLTTNELANLFVQVLINPNQNYAHPRKKNVLVTNSYGEISLDIGKFSSFFSRFEGDKYTNKEKKELSNCVDRLIEDTTRRKKGEFYTPKIWVDKAHEYLDAALGENWRDEYVVWDNSCGQGNLTKDYTFTNLIQTTIEPSDIETLKQANTNPNSIKASLDFLNDDIPQDIQDAIRGKKLLVLMNPPYKTAGNNKRDENADTGVAVSKTRDNMIKDKWSGYGQLYAQFIYRSLMLKKELGCEVSLAVFAKYAYLSSSSFKEFRTNMLNQVDYNSGFMFNAGEFSGTSDKWPVCYAIFKHK